MTPDLREGPERALAGVRLGVDVGQVRIGVAVSDPGGLIATPVDTVRRDPADPSAGIAEVARIARERDAVVVYIGLPRHLSGVEGSASAAVRAYSEALARVVDPAQVRLVDERLSTVTAHQVLHASGRAGRRHRDVVDQAAAVIILQSALDVERSRGVVAGELVAPADGDELAARSDAGGPEEGTDMHGDGRVEGAR